MGFTRRHDRRDAADRRDSLASLVACRSSLVARCSLLVGIAVCVFGACNGDDKATEDTGSFAFGTPDCHGSTNDCTPELRVDEAIVRTCFGWDGPSQQYLDTGLPPQLLTDCPNPEIVGAECVFNYDDELGVTCNNTCGDCIPLVGPADTGAFPIDEIGGPNDACCDCDPALTGLDELIDALAACGFAGTTFYDCPDPDWILQDDSECSDGASFAIAPGADKIMHIDPLLSYIRLQTGTDTETFAVAGGGSARTSTDQFMTATLWAAGGNLANFILTDWTFWTSAPMDYDPTSGSFTVHSHASPAFWGRGLIGTTPSKAEVYMSSDATGNINPSMGRWEANYSESVGGEGIQVHLEGTYGNLP